MADPYRIPSGHVGGGRFAKRGDVGEAIVRAAKSVYHALADGELDLERGDLTEGLDHAVKSRADAARRLAAQTERTVANFGDRASWPASSEHAVQQLEAEVGQLDGAIATYRDAIDELDAVTLSRREAGAANDLPVTDDIDTVPVGARFVDTATGIEYTRSRDGGAIDSTGRRVTRDYLRGVEDADGERLDVERWEPKPGGGVEHILPQPRQVAYRYVEAPPQATDQAVPGETPGGLAASKRFSAQMAELDDWGKRTAGLKKRVQNQIAESITDEDADALLASGLVPRTTAKTPEGRRRHVARAFVDGWADNPDVGIVGVLQLAVADRFGDRYPGLADAARRYAESARSTADSAAAKGMWDKHNAWRDAPEALMSDHPDTMRRIVDGIYEATQADLAERGVTELTVWRGTGGIEGRGGDTDYMSNPMSSWGARPNVAYHFAGISGGKEPAVLSVTVPADRVFATPFTGPGSLGEYEAVLIGGTHPVHVHTKADEMAENPGVSNDLPPLIVDAPPTPSSSSPSVAAAAEMVALHHETFGYNGITLPTLPTIANGERYRRTPLPAATQAAALNSLFRPAPGGPLPPPILDDNGLGAPVRTVAVELDSGAVAGWLSPNPEMPPYGRWAALPADHPEAPALVTAGWLASAPVERYLAETVQPRLRAGLPVDEPRYPGLVEAATATSDSILADLRGTDIAVRRVTDPDLGAYYEPDPASPLALDGDAIHYADFDTDGSLRLWASGDATDRPDLTDPLSRIDYTDADDPDLPWDERVAALADARRALLDVLGPDPAALFDSPNEADFDTLLTGVGGDREYTVLAAFDRFGESLDGIIEARRAALSRAPDKPAILAKLRDLPDFPEPVAAFLESQPWESATIGNLLDPTSAAPGGGGLLRITFPDDPDSYVIIGTTVGRPAAANVGWEFSAAYQMANPDTFATLPPSGMVTGPADHLPREWYTDVVDTGNISRTGDTPSALRAVLDTYEALGIDMGTDTSIMVAEGRDVAAEQAGYPQTGAVPIRLADATGEMAATADVGLRPFPKSWTTTLGARLTRIHTDTARPGATGTSNNFASTGVIDVPSVVQHPDLADAATHEFTHLLERTVPGLMNIETWHIIQRLRAEASRRDDLAVWTHSEGIHGYSDEFGLPYMGRVYRDPYTGVTGVTGAGGHEVFSTVAQGLWGHNWRARVNLDPPARRLLLALMGLLDPPAPTPWRPR